MIDYKIKGNSLKVAVKPPISMFCMKCMKMGEYNTKQINYMTCQRCLEFTCDDCNHECIIRKSSLFSYRSPQEKISQSLTANDIIVEDI